MCCGPTMSFSCGSRRQEPGRSSPTENHHRSPGSQGLRTAHPFVAGDCLTALSPFCWLCNIFIDVSVPMEGFVLEDVRRRTRAQFPGSEYKNFPVVVAHLVRSAVTSQRPA